MSSDGTGKSVFFTFGKGVLTQHPEGAYIDEIGVGHRGTNGGEKAPLGALTYDEWVGNTKKYGALYWTSTHFGGSSNTSHLGKADFSYDILKSIPYAIDVPTNPNAAGLHSKWHGNFVRCVRSGNEATSVDLSNSSWGSPYTKFGVPVGDLKSSSKIISLTR